MVGPDYHAACAEITQHFMQDCSVCHLVEVTGAMWRMELENTAFKRRDVYAISFVIGA